MVPEEDAKLKEFMDKHGTGGNWIALPQKAGLRRCGKSCRLRWLNYLRPNIKHGEFTDHEDRVICSMYASIGSRWSIIASQLPGRTDNDIKNYWNTKLKKKLLGSNTGSGPPARLPRHHPHQHRPVQLLPYSSSPSSNYNTSSFFPGAGSQLLNAEPHGHLIIPTLTLQPQLQDYTMLSSSLNPMANHNHNNNVDASVMNHMVKEECGAMIVFGGGEQQSCSSSDGTQFGQFGGRHGKELSMSFDNNNNGYGYGGYHHNNGAAVEQEVQAQLDYGYEEIKQLLMTAAGGGGGDGGGLHDQLISSSHAAGKLTMM